MRERKGRAISSPPVGGFHVDCHCSSMMTIANRYDSAGYPLFMRLLNIINRHEVLIRESRYRVNDHQYEM